MRHLLVATCLAVLLGAITARTAGAVLPLEDDGFTPTTPRPDPDLIVVRERAYGAAGVDLTAYGIGSGPVSYVQSVYFRFFVDNASSSVDAFTGRVTFTPGVRILGIITGGTDLGGAADNGTATETDLLFGVAADPDDYSEDARGFECCGGTGSSEFVCQTSPTSFVYGLNITNGVDDFRVIIAYEDSFTTGQSFSITSFEVGQLGGAAPSTGIRVGNDAAPAVFGSGDYGEAAGLLNIPLTATEPPVTVGGLVLDPYQSVFLLRDTPGNTYVDAYQLDLQLPAADLFSITSSVLSNPVGITDGPDSLLYAIGRGGGYAVLDPETETVLTVVLLADLAGNNMDLTNLPGTRDLFFLRDGVDTYVDRFDPGTQTHVDADTIPAAVVSNPVAITDAADGMLYVLGAAGGLVRLDPVSGDHVVLTPATIPAGTYVSVTGVEGANELYLLRSDGAAKIDRYDIDLDLLTADVATVASMSGAASITDAAGQRLVVVGSGSSGPAVVAEIDLQTAGILNENSCLDFAGSNVSVTNIGTDGGTVSVDDGDRSGTFDLVHAAYPNPFTGGTTLHYRLPAVSRVEVAVFDPAGRRVAVLERGFMGAGEHAVSWDGRDAAGRRASPGVYVYRIKVGARTAIGRLTLVR